MWFWVILLCLKFQKKKWWVLSKEEQRKRGNRLRKRERERERER